MICELLKSTEHPSRPSPLVAEGLITTRIRGLKASVGGFMFVMESLRKGGPRREVT